MSHIDPQFSRADNQLANFAKALAMPVRIAIIRAIIVSNNNISKENLLTIPYKTDTINRHLTRLKEAGIIKESNAQGLIKFSLDKDVFIQNANGFITLFEGDKDQQT